MKDKHQKLANLLTKGILRNHRKCAVAIGTFGSVANSTQKPYSDLDMVVIADKKSENKFFIFREGNERQSPLEIGKDIKVNIFFKTKEEAERAVLGISDLNWPTKVGMLLNVSPMYDPDKFFDSLLKKYSNLKSDSSFNEDFRRLAARWVSIAYEFLGKIKNLEGNETVARVYAKEFSFCIANMVKAVNKEYFVNIYNFVEEVKQIPFKPFNSYYLLENLLDCTAAETILQIATELWKNTQDFAQKYKIEVVVHSEKQVQRELKNLFR